MIMDFYQTSPSRSLFASCSDFSFSKDIKECSMGTHNCSTTTMNCNEMDGGFTCSCKTGYTGDGSSCTG